MLYVLYLLTPYTCRIRLMIAYVQAILFFSFSLQLDSFYFNILPFAEDIREFQFRSFSSLPSSSQPTKEQQEAADNLVKMLDLAPPGREEILKPDFTPNPMLEVLFFLQNIAIYQNQFRYSDIFFSYYIP
jgi:hypothetical protein